MVDVPIGVKAYHTEEGPGKTLKASREDLRNKFNDNELVISTLMITVLNVLSIIPLMSGLFRICLENDFFPFLFVFGVVLEFVR